jgi:hypothetical protein
MNRTALTLGLVAAVGLPAAAEAKSVTLNTTLANYGGNGAYLAIYLTDGQGKFHSTLYVAGRKAKYHSHLRDWARGKATENLSIDGITGASVGSGQSLRVRAEVADALIDAGYQIRIDSSVENGRDIPADIMMPLSPATAGKPTAGKGYVKSFSFDM